MKIETYSLTELKLATPCPICTTSNYKDKSLVIDVEELHPDETEYISGRKVCSMCKGRGVVLTRSGNSLLELIREFL